MQFLILQGGLCGQLIVVGADLRFQLGKVALGDASRREQARARSHSARLTARVASFTLTASVA